MSRFPHVEFLLSVAAPVQFPPDAGAEVAIAGRSNAGKSSAINAIAERKALARTSKTPGQTRLLNYFELEESHRIVDLPGYGYAAVRPDERRKWVPLIDALRARTSLKGLCLIVDSRRGLRRGFWPDRMGGPHAARCPCAAVQGRQIEPSGAGGRLERLSCSTWQPRERAGVFGPLRTRGQGSPISLGSAVGAE